MKLKSPAKVNLFLRVVGRRSDGYHDLASLFQTISLYDTIDYHLADADSLTCNDPSIPVDKSNLISKAVDLFKRKTGKNFKVKIHIDKQIPIQAGLGGGSSNAATTLWAMNRLTKALVADEKLQEWSAEIGSDIPFFFSQGTAYCTGRGEVVRPLSPLNLDKMLIIKPDQGLSTPAVFGKFKLSEQLNWSPEQALHSIASPNPIYLNDLEVPAFELYPDLKNLKDALLQEGFRHVLMTGSGSALLCIGGASLPSFPNTKSYPASPLNRTDGWY